MESDLVFTVYISPIKVQPGWILFVCNLFYHTANEMTVIHSGRSKGPLGRKREKMFDVSFVIFAFSSLKDEI